jgi:hypothetical protein
MSSLSRRWRFRYLAIHENLGPTAVLERCAAGAGDTAWVLALGIECVFALETNIEEPSVEEIVLNAAAIGRRAAHLPSLSAKKERAEARSL